VVRSTRNITSISTESASPRCGKITKIDSPREIFPKVFKHLRLLALDPYDLALSKLERNIQRDRDDVKHLAKTVPFDLEVLKERYQKELRWQLGNPDREDLTLRLWIDAIEEERSR
jgi:hypothetical protein